MFTNMYPKRRYPVRAKVAAKAATTKKAAAPAAAPRRRTVAVKPRSKYVVANARRAVSKSVAHKNTPGRYVKGSKVKKMVEGPPTFLEQIAAGAGQVASLARAVAPMIEMINTEAKFIDEGGNNVVTSGAPYLIPLTSNMIQGTGESERIGSSVLLKDLNIKTFINRVVDTGATPAQLGCFIRMTVFCWKENEQENAPTPAKIFNGGTFSAFTNKDNTDQFVILKDKIITLEPTINGGSTASAIFKFQKYFKKLDWHARWTEDDFPTVNQIWLLFTSSSAQDTGVTWLSRINYTDN